ncbi:MAG: response regulator [Planctomycetales bacterium]|nr:response regulator [Planctomycetales bacterium]NIM09605.1 response regulator [Planctomycetales bacterium]NIN09094.1 response regulator [Planctomycetales bacterium]NIN78201.1 response regulator [Planctomycetales bacterium]NIO35392.1 response regulator [Planctomycetales bacterium]
MPIRILIADDQEVVRRGLRRMLADTDVEIAGEAVNGRQAIEMAGQLDLNLVLLEVSISAGGGVRVLASLRESQPGLPVLMFSASDHPNFVARCVALGACGYLLKNASRARLVSAIRKAAAGEMLWRRAQLRRASGALAVSRLPIETEISLTDRETQILPLLAQGLTNKHIATTLKISHETVKEHVQHIFRKLGVTHRTQAAIWAVRNEVA